MLFGKFIEETSDDYNTRIIGVIICSLGGMTYAIEAIIFNKAKKVNNQALTHYLNVFCILLFPFCGFLSYKFQQWIIPTKYDIFLLIMMGVMGNSGQASYSRAY